MKTDSARIPQGILLVLSMIFTGISLPLQLTSQSKAQIPNPEGKPKPESGKTQSTTATTAGQEDKSSQPVGRFSIEEGKSRHVTFQLGHKCLTENLMRMKVVSEKRLFQLEGSTDSVLFRPGSNGFSANLDATKVKQGVYPVKVNLKCLNCNNCGVFKANVIVEITVKPSTEPSNDAADKDDKKVQELSEGGPQFPETFDMSNFSAVFIIREGWPLALKYELEEGATASVTVQPFRNKQPVSFQIPATGTGQVKTIIFMLPEQLGSQPQAAQLTFKAVFVDPEKGSRPANFNIHALGVGPAALKPAIYSF